jgi:hypothetical protein
MMRLKMCLVVLTVVAGTLATAQENGAVNPAVEKPRVFVTDSQSWEIMGGGGGSSAGFGGAVKGGARPQTAEIIKTFGERCPQVTVNNQRERADYVALLDHEGGKGWGRRDNKVAVFNKDGDSIVSHSTVSLGNAVKDACEAIVKDWPISAAKLRATPPAFVPALVPAKASETVSVGKLTVSSTPPNADIEVDGGFVGNTPSTLELAPGEHEIVIKKSGFQNWQRKMKIGGGAINILAEMEKMP